MTHVVTINITTREVSDINPADVRKVNIVEAKGEGGTLERAFQAAYDNSGLREFVEAFQGAKSQIITPGPGKFGQGS